MHRTKKIKNMWATPSPTTAPTTIERPATHHPATPATHPHAPAPPHRAQPITPATITRKSSTTPTAPCTPASPHPPSPPRGHQHTATTANKAVALVLMHKRLGVHPSVFIRNDPISPLPITPYNSPSHPITPHHFAGKIITLAVHHPSPWKAAPSPLGHMVPGCRCRSHHPGPCRCHRPAHIMSAPSPWLAPALAPLGDALWPHQSTPPAHIGSRYLLQANNKCNKLAIIYLFLSCCKQTTSKQQVIQQAQRGVQQGVQHLAPMC